VTARLGPEHSVKCITTSPTAIPGPLASPGQKLCLALGVAVIPVHGLERAETPPRALRNARCLSSPAENERSAPQTGETFFFFFPPIMTLPAPDDLFPLGSISLTCHLARIHRYLGPKTAGTALVVAAPNFVGRPEALMLGPFRRATANRTWPSTSFGGGIAWRWSPPAPLSGHLPSVAS
jgi:hypothetical protein